MTDERAFIEKHYPHVLDMASMMIIAGMQIVDRTDETAIAALKFERQTDGQFQFSYLSSSKKDELDKFIEEAGVKYTEFK